MLLWEATAQQSRCLAFGPFCLDYHSSQHQGGVEKERPARAGGWRSGERRPATHCSPRSRVEFGKSAGVDAKVAPWEIPTPNPTVSMQSLPDLPLQKCPLSHCLLPVQPTWVLGLECRGPGTPGAPPSLAKGPRV